MWVATDESLLNLAHASEIRQEGDKLIVVWDSAEFQTELKFSDYGRAKIALQKCIALLNVTEEL